MSQPTKALARNDRTDVAKFATGVVFDGDGSQYIPGHSQPCTLCGIWQGIVRPPTTFVRVRRRVDGGTREVAWLCPDCIGRAMIQVNRLGLLRQMRPTVRGALRRMINKRVAARTKGRETK